MEKELLSIDIGTDLIKLVSGKPKSNITVIDHMYSVKTPQDSYTDGKILAFDTLADAIYGGIKQSGIKTKDAVITMQSTSEISREIILPWARSKDLDSMVKFEIEQYLPISFNEYVVEYKHIEDFNEDGIKKSRVQVSAIPKIIVEGFLDLFEDLELNAIAMDINSNAAPKLLGSKVKLNNNATIGDRNIAIIDIGHNSTNVIILNKGINMFSRLVNLGGSELDKRLTEMLNIEPSIAETKKKNEIDVSLLISDSLNVSYDWESPVRNFLNDWINEIERLFQYYRTRGGNYRVDEIYLYGGGSRLKGLCEYMTENLNLPVTLLESIGSIKLGSKIKTNDVYNYLNAIGAIIRK